jgi:hypothetical protein
MDDVLRLRLKEAGLALRQRATEISSAGGDGDLATLMAEVAVTTDALLVLGADTGRLGRDRRRNKALAVRLAVL